jgi:Thoeris protein ThsA, Macro domain
MAGNPDLSPGVAPFFRTERMGIRQLPIRRAGRVLRSPVGRRLFIAQSLVAFGVISAVIQFLAALYRTFPPYPAVIFAVTLTGCAAWGFIRNYPRFTLTHRMANTDATLSIVVGDLFAQETHVAVGFSDTFDTATGGNQVIDSASLQGQLLRRVYDDDQRQLDRDLSAALNGIKPVKKESRSNKPRGKLTRYPIGTVAVLGRSRWYTFAVAYGRMGNDMTVRAPVEDLWYCFSQLWEAVYREGQRGPVSVPLMGSGLARLNSLDHENLLRLIVLSFAAYSRMKLICPELRIVIRPEDVTRIDLIRLREFLSTFQRRSRANRKRNGSSSGLSREPACRVSSPLMENPQQTMNALPMESGGAFTVEKERPWALSSTYG